MKNLKLIILAGSMMFFAAACQNNPNRTGSSVGNTENEQTDQPVAKANYTCPMHPEVTSDHPGECPKCGMALVVADSTDADSTLAL